MTSLYPIFMIFKMGFTMVSLMKSRFWNPSWKHISIRPIPFNWIYFSFFLWILVLQVCLLWFCNFEGQILYFFLINLRSLIGLHIFNFVKFRFWNPSWTHISILNIFCLHIFNFVKSRFWNPSWKHISIKPVPFNWIYFLFFLWILVLEVHLLWFCNFEGLYSISFS